MNKMKSLLALLCVALLCVACGKDPVADPTGSSGQMAETEESTPVEDLPSVEDNQFDESEIMIPTNPAGVDTTGNSVATGTGDQGGSGNQGSTGSQGSSGGNNENPTKPKSDSRYVSYEEYNAMTPEAQEAYFNTFSSMEAFVQWYNEAKEAYEEENGAVEIGVDGSVDIGDLGDIVSP